jgi:uncharacterized protein YjbI with pentapeptide repeats
VPNRLAGGPQSSSDDLYTKIALDNKLITRYHLRQASKEQEDLAAAGQSVPLGAVLVRMGFLTEGQHQSVINACRYREQRDYDKRFARQILRMELLPQSSIEESLEDQKKEYGQSGVVAPLADGLEAAGKLTSEQVEAVHKGIQQRDKSRARQGGAPAGSPLAVSGPTPVLAARTGEDDPTVEGSPLAAKKDDLDDLDVDDLDADLDDADLDDEDLDDADLDDEDLDDVDLDDLDDEDLDDDDLDDIDLDDLDDEDLDDEDLDDEDLDDVDLDDLDDEDLDDVDLDDDDLDEAAAGLDSDLASVADLQDDELDSDMGAVADLDDESLELDSVANLESDEDLGDIDLDDIDLDDLTSEPRRAGDLDEDESDLAALNLDDLDEDSLEAGSSDVGEDEDDLAQVASELDSEVQLDDEDIKAIEELGSAEELEGAVGWAAEAFDDRPLGQRPPSERMPVANSDLAAPPAAPPLPRRPEAPAPPSRRVPAAAPRPPAPAAKRSGGIPGGSVFDENLSDMGKTSSAGEKSESAGPPTDMGPVEDFGDLVESADIAPDDGTGSEDLLEPTDAPSEERRAMIESAVTSAVERTLASSADTSMPSDAASPGFDPSDPKVRAAFERAVEDAVRQAMDTAFDSFLKELRQGGA